MARLILCFLSASSSKGRASRSQFLSPDFHELWHSVMSFCLFTVSVMALQLALVDQNPFQSWFFSTIHAVDDAYILRHCLFRYQVSNVNL